MPLFEGEDEPSRPEMGPATRVRQEPAPPLSTVTARRFCDQQDASLQTATGRSLP